MKMMKKLAMLLLAICLVVPCFTMVSYAADGKIMFTDPSTAVGETLEITGVIQKSSSTLGKIEITMTYDTTYLKFKSGDGIIESQAGEITYTGDATRETGSRKEFVIVFDVLKEGTTKLDIKSATIKNVAGTVMNYTKGSSTITIAAGEGTTVVDPEEPGDVASEANIEIDGETYAISNNIPQNKIPDGYEAAVLEYDMVEYNVVHNGDFGLSLAYLIGPDGTGDLFMYVEEDATFAPYQEITISDSVRITLLSDVSDIVLPSEYTSTEVMLNGYEFPAWQNSEDMDFCILYAINNSGEKTLYQLDNAEGTYQRFTAPEVVNDEIDNSFIGKLSNLLENHLDYVILGTGLGFILFIIIIVVLSVKLYNRNAELDEIYDEYGIDEEEHEEDDYEDDFEDDDEDENKEMEMLVQVGMKEVFPEYEEVVEEVSEDPAEELSEEIAEEPEKETTVKPVEQVTSNTVEIPIEKVNEQEVDNEGTLGQALARQLEANKEEQEEYYDDDDDVLDNFSMDFIDLDD